jgi:thiamine biosynthesis lipoprotein
VITSGDYQRYIMVNGKRIHHIIDPASGRSADSGLMGVTIVGKNGAQCDAMSTAVFVLGVEKGLELVRAQGLEAVLVTNDNKIYLTQGLKGVFTLTNTAYAIQ